MMKTTAEHISVPQKISKAEVKRLNHLTTKKGRDDSGLFLVEGWKAAAEALTSSWEVVTLLFDPARTNTERDDVLLQCVNRKVRVWAGTPAEVRSLSDVMHDQGVVTVVRSRPWSFRDLPSNGDLLVLDGVSDPGNLGTLVRTADWFGLSAVIIGPGSASPYNEKVVRATMGSIFRVPIIPVADLAAACRSLHTAGVVLAGAVVHGGKWTSWLSASRTALILGSEAHGISPEVQSLLTVSVSIPRIGAAESLNVAGAGAVLMSSLADQRLRSNHETP